MALTFFSYRQLLLVTISLFYISTTVTALPSPQQYEEQALWADDAVREAEQDRLAVSRVGMTEWSDDVITSCPEGQALCAIYEGDELLTCVEVQTELETCGGCPGDLGQDCGEIEGANGVQCSKIGTCIVSTCLSGYQVAVDGQSCVKTTFTDMSSGQSGMVRRTRRSSGRNDTL